MAEKVRTCRGMLEIKKPRDFTGLEIQQIRLSLGFTQEGFAKMLGVAVSTYTYWEAGTKPIGPARRLLELIRNKGESFLDDVDKI